MFGYAALSSVSIFAWRACGNSPSPSAHAIRSQAPTLDRLDAIEIVPIQENRHEQHD